MKEATHQEPIWRDRANFIIATQIDPGDTQVGTEQLWAREIDQLHYELCCIPFFAYDMSLGDIVEVDADYMVRKVTRRSGRFVFRVYFERPSSSIQAITDQLLARRGLLEWSSPKLLAVDAEDATTAQSIADFLHEQQADGSLMYETGKTA